MSNENELSKNKHFLIGLMNPYIMGAEAQLGRVLAAHVINSDSRYTITQHCVFLYELSNLLEHLDMLRKYRLNAGLPSIALDRKIADFRNEIRHTSRFDKEDKKRGERLGKNPKLMFCLKSTNAGIIIGNTDLTFKEIDLYIQQVKSELHALLGTLQPA